MGWRLLLEPRGEALRGVFYFNHYSELPGAHRNGLSCYRDDRNGGLDSFFLPYIFGNAVPIAIDSQEPWTTFFNLLLHHWLRTAQGNS
jgi:hypothetical protein